MTHRWSRVLPTPMYFTRQWLLFTEPTARAGVGKKKKNEKRERRERKRIAAGDGVNEEEDAKEGSIQRILAPPRPPEPASPRPNYRAHRSHHLVHVRNLHPTSISFVVVELNVSCEIVEGN